MKRKQLSSLTLYVIAITVIFSWWYAAFLIPAPRKTVKNQTGPATDRMRVAPPQYLSCLTSLDRCLIQQALSGDIKLMTTLMADWDVDARILENHGLINAKRLSRNKFLRGQMLGRKLLNAGDRSLLDLQERSSASTTIDDSGFAFDIDASCHKFLPQTYVSASFLLALTDPENIVAIPQGFRNQRELYSKSITDRIPLDINRYNAEKIYQNKPDIAFVASYSHPSTLQALSNQGIPLFRLDAVNTLPEISDAITRIGNVAHRPLEAELLTLFMESAMLAIDNHLLAMSSAAIEEYGSPRILFLNHLSTFSIPTEKTITGHLLERLSSHKFSFIAVNKGVRDDWMIPIDQEQIVNINPDCLIVATTNSDDLKMQIDTSPAFQLLSAAKRRNIFFIDAAPQAPTQYAVLAYYDIADALTRISHTLSSEGGEDVTSGSFLNSREHCQSDKARLFANEDNVTDCTVSPCECEKYGSVNATSPYLR